MKSFPPPTLVAVVEDTPELRTDLVEFLHLRGMTARGFGSAEAFFQAWPDQRFDLLLLDLILPGADGLKVARRVRAQDTTGIVMLTALSAIDHQLAGLGAGADAYLSKSSPLEVIEATCRSVLRRLRMQGSTPVSVGRSIRWCLRHQQWSLETPNRTLVNLTHSETTFLAALFDKPGEVVEREKLLALLGKQDSLTNLRNLDNAASRLRRKVLQACGLEIPIRPSYARGYTFVGPCEVVA